MNNIDRLRNHKDARSIKITNECKKEASTFCEPYQQIGQMGHLNCMQRFLVACMTDSLEKNTSVRTFPGIGNISGELLFIRLFTLISMHLKAPL
jgi:hypothetical protein